MTSTAVYLIYLAIIAAIVLPVARSLERAGAIFIADDLTGRVGAGRAVGRIIGLGFALINLGHALGLVKAGRFNVALSTAQVIDLLSDRLGGMLVTIGVTFAIGIGIIATVHGAFVPKRRSAPTKAAPAQPAAQN